MSLRYAGWYATHVFRVPEHPSAAAPFVLLPPHQIESTDPGIRTTFAMVVQTVRSFYYLTIDRERRSDGGPAGPARRSWRGGQLLMSGRQSSAFRPIAVAHAHLPCAGTCPVAGVASGEKAGVPRRGARRGWSRLGRSPAGMIGRQAGRARAFPFPR